MLFDTHAPVSYTHLLAVRQDTHMTAEARAAGRRGNDSAGLDEDLGQTLLNALQVNLSLIHISATATRTPAMVSLRIEFFFIVFHSSEKIRQKWLSRPQPCPRPGA